ncbi:MAG: thioesterase family protein [Dehalococcoidia bacterium]|nr:thioesterase family protein [Dehalococcoidia bacterium]
MKEIPVGHSNEMTIVTTPEMGIRHLGPAASLYSTPAMVEHIEATALQSLLPFLEPGEQSVGVRINVAHMAPTPIGMKVTIRTTLQEVDGRRCVFAVEAHNEAGMKIGEGTHERRVIDISRFTAGARGQ